VGRGIIYIFIYVKILSLPSCKVKTMSEEAQNRVDEDFESEEGDLESYLEEESSSELLERVRELQVSAVYFNQEYRFVYFSSSTYCLNCSIFVQAENSALSLANESQREAYERCLDEVS